MYRALRSVCFIVCVSTLAVLSMPGCSQQGEGERCDAARTGNSDCDAGLGCVPKAQLAEKKTDRCCPAPNTESDSRCHRLGTSVSVAGSSSSGGSAGSSSGGGTAGSSSGGTAAGESSGGGSAELAAGATGVSDGGSDNLPSNSGGMSGAATDGGVSSIDPNGGKGGAP